MFNKQQAEQLLHKIFKELFEKGDVDLVADTYHIDVIGHHNGTTFNYDDIVKRARLLNEYCQDKKKFEIKEFYVIDNIIIGTCRQTWLTPQDSQLCESVVAFTYRIVDNKVKELWLLNQDINLNYVEINNKFEEFLKCYAVTAIGKDSFFKYLRDFEYFFQKHKIEFTEREEEVLFYYLRGHTAKEIAREMNLSHRTIESHISNILDKTRCNSKAELRIKLFP
jgi:DNA-binding CsgD family transcriptional regulator/predicted SnoaL-like aldol condensation-catalyzing enzyme